MTAAVCPGRNEQSASQNMNKDDRCWTEEEYGDLGCQARGIHVKKQALQPFLQQLLEIPHSSAQNPRMSNLLLLKHCSKASIKTESKYTESKILALVEMKDKFAC